MVAGITPFNFPAMVPMWMFGNAIACGNTFILKPSEKDPSASVYMAELLKEAGLPDGVFNVVHGDKVAVDAHPGASRHRGRLVRRLDAGGALHLRDRHGERQARAGAGRRQEPHGGAARTPISSMAADAAVSAAYGSAGERCMAISVVVAVGERGRSAGGRHRARLPKIKVGPGTDPEAEMGPLITREHRDKVAALPR